MAVTEFLIANGYFKPEQIRRELMRCRQVSPKEFFGLPENVDSTELPKGIVISKDEEGCLVEAPGSQRETLVRVIHGIRYFTRSDSCVRPI